MPRYSVVMPAKNSESTIENAIKSILISFPRDTEVVVWDDGSTDQTSEIAKSVDKKRVRVIESSTSVGGGIARQNIINATDSEYIVNQDSDDISLPWRHFVQSRLIEKADFVFTAVNRFSGHFHIHRPSLPLSYSSKDVSISLLFHNTLSHPTMLAKRRALVEVGGYSNTRMAQDYEMLLRAAAKDKVIIRTGIPTLLYRLSTTQISQQADYAYRIKNSPEILTSYADLVNRLIPNNSYHFSNPTRASEIMKINPGDITALVNNLSPILQPFYRRILKQGRLGHIGEMALTSK